MNDKPNDTNLNAELIKSIREAVKSEMNNSHDLKPEEINIKELYVNNEIDFEGWIKNSNYTKQHENKIIHDNQKIFSYDVKNIKEIKRLLGEGKLTSKINLSFRKFIKYLDIRALLDIIFIQVFERYISGKTKKCYDNFIPDINEVKKTLDILKEFCMRDEFLILKLMVESGLRSTEIIHFIETFDESKIESFENISIYPMFYIRGKKASYYLYCSSKTMTRVKLRIDSLQKLNLKKIFEKLRRRVEKAFDEKLISPKYYRKFMRHNLVMLSCNSETVDYIQGRISGGSVGFRHYSDGKLLGLKVMKVWLRFLTKKNVFGACY